jgi:hypothetical protein
VGEVGLTGQELSLTLQRSSVTLLRVAPLHQRIEKTEL